MEKSRRSAKKQVVSELKEYADRTHEMADDVEDRFPAWADKLRRKAAMYTEAADYIQQAFN